MGTIHLIRHGPSAHVNDGRWFLGRDSHRYDDAYDAAGIRDDTPPPGIVDLAQNAGALLSSDLRRAIESARRLAPDREPRIVPALRELRLESPHWVPAPLPIQVWDALNHLRWTMRMAFDIEHPTTRQAAQAADVLLEAAAHTRSVVAVTHGGIRRLITAELQRRGRRLIAREGRHQNWSCWTLG